MHKSAIKFTIILLKTWNLYIFQTSMVHNKRAHYLFFSKMAQEPIHLVISFHFSEKCFLDMLSPCVVISGGSRILQISPLVIFFSGATTKQRLTNNAPNFGSSEGGDTTGSCCHYTWNDFQGHGQLRTEAISVYRYSRPHLSDVLFKTCWCKMAFCVLWRNRKTSAVSSLVLNLIASQIGEFFLPHPVLFNKDELILRQAILDKYEAC